MYLNLTSLKPLKLIWKNREGRKNNLKGKKCLSKALWSKRCQCSVEHRTRDGLVEKTLPLGLEGPADPMVRGASVANRKALWSLWQPL